VTNQDDPESSRCRIDVYAPSVIDVVECIGAWIFDHVMAGWDVRVSIPAPFDDRPLRILGAESGALEAMLHSTPAPAPAAILISSDLITSDIRVRARGTDALRGGMIEVTTWGQSCPAGLAQHSRVTECQPSLAAATFKFYALVAAGGSPQCARSPEVLYRNAAQYAFG
jgi:hypothetical protein